MADKIDEGKILLNQYRRHNLLLNDRIFNISNNILPQKDKAIENLKNQVATLSKENDMLKKCKSWFVF
tara:strand:+ start:1131 stop:1334 length:204 start_codon:yes stop_codon:yes gene_type:complete